MKLPSHALAFVLVMIAITAPTVVVSGTARAGGITLDPREWPAEIYTLCGDGLNRGTSALVDTLYDQFDNYDLYALPLGEHSNGRARVEREVFDNHDALGTWTVVDRARITASGSPLANWSNFLASTVTQNIGTPSIYGIFEPQATLEWTNYRQVSARGFKRREKLDELAAEVESLKKTVSTRYDKNPAKLPAADPNVTELNPYTPWYYLDDSIRARFTRFLNPLTFPLRTPLSTSVVKEKMADGEVIAWTFSGRIETGVGSGWKIIPDPTLQTAGIDTRVTAITEGTFRVSVLRESARFAKVKISRSYRAGEHHAVTAGFRRNNLFKGFLLLGGTGFEQRGVLSQNLSLVPFQSDDTNLWGQLFDVGYRYDLDSEEGRDAYHHAVLGSLAGSDELATRDEDHENAPVKRVFSRKAKTRDSERRRSAELSFLLKRDSTKKLNTLEARIELPDGQHHVFKSVAESKDRLRTFYSTNDEKTSYRLSVLLDQELYEKNEPASLLIIGEATYEDSSTSGKDLFRTTQQIESFVGNGALFPEISYSVPKSGGDPENHKMKRVWFGRSSFYWGFHLSRADIEYFLETDAQRRKTWVDALIPKGKREGVHQQWDAAYESYRRQDAKGVFHALKELFGDRTMGRELMMLLRVGIGARPMDYFVTANNKSFGRVQYRGKAQNSVEALLTRTDKEMEFEGYTRRQKDDQDALITDLTATQDAKGLLHISFTLKEEPKTVDFRISRELEMRGVRDLRLPIGRSERAEDAKDPRFVQITFANGPDGGGKGNVLFHRGSNSFVLDPKSDIDLFYRLSKKLYREHTYLLQATISRDGKRFGALVGTKLKPGAAYPSLRPELKQASKPSTVQKPTPSYIKQ